MVWRPHERPRPDDDPRRVDNGALDAGSSRVGAADEISFVRAVRRPSSASLRSGAQAQPQRQPVGQTHLYRAVAHEGDPGTEILM